MAKDISVALTLDNKQFDRGIKQSSKDVQNFGSTSTKSLAKTAAGVAALSAAFAGLKKAFTITATFQDLQSSLSTVFGGLDQGAAAFERVTDIASRTQFQVEDITKAFIQLKGAGIDPTEKTIMTFANAAAITTDQIGAFQAAISLLSRTTAGGLGLEELERLGDRGIPVYDILNEKLGITRTQISEVGKTARGSAKIIEALGDGINERFGDALGNRLENTNQRISNFNDQLSILATNLLSSANQGFGDLVANLTKAVQSLNENVSAIVAVGKALSGLLVIAVTTLGGKGIMKLFDKLIISSGFLAGAISFLVKTFRTVTGISAASTAMNAHLRITGEMAMKTQKLTLAQRKMLRVFAGGAAILQFAGVIYGLTRAYQAYLDVLDQREADIVTAIVGKGRETVVKEINDLSLKILELTEAMNLYYEATRFSLRDTPALALGGKATEIQELQRRVAALKEELKEMPEIIPKDDGDGEKVLSTLDKIAEAIDGAGKNFRSDKQFKIFLDDLMSLKDLATSNEEIIAFDQAVKKLYDTFGQELPSTVFDDLKESIGDITSFDAFDAVMLQTVELLKQGKLSADEYALALALLNESVEELNPYFETFKDAVSDAGDALGNDLAEAIVEGEGAMEAFKNSFKNVIKQVLAEAIKLMFVKQLISGLFGLFDYDVQFGSGSDIASVTKQVPPKKAQGGPASANTAYMVGEQGPELFVPSTNGNVIPNGAGGSSPVTNNYITNNINAMDSRSVAQVFAENSQTLLGTVEFARKQTSYGR